MGTRNILLDCIPWCFCNLWSSALINNQMLTLEYAVDIDTFDRKCVSFVRGSTFKKHIQVIPFFCNILANKSENCTKAAVHNKEKCSDSAIYQHVGIKMSAFYNWKKTIKIFKVNSKIFQLNFSTNRQRSWQDDDREDNRFQSRFIFLSLFSFQCEP